MEWSAKEKGLKWSGPVTYLSAKELGLVLGLKYIERMQVFSLERMQVFSPERMQVFSLERMDWVDGSIMLGGISCTGKAD